MPDERTDPEASQDGQAQPAPGKALALPSRDVFQGEAAPDPDSHIEDMVERLKQRSAVGTGPVFRPPDLGPGPGQPESPPVVTSSTQEATFGSASQTAPPETERRTSDDAGTDSRRVPSPDRGQASDTAQSREPRASHERASRASLPATFPADTVKIGLWGSPSSGKTTFLAALRSAIIDPYGRDSHIRNGMWNIFPADDVSERLMVQLIDDLINGRFPEKNPLDATRELVWLFRGDLGDSRNRQRDGLRRRLASVAGSRFSEFVLDLVDVSGEAFAPLSDVPQNIKDRALDHLAHAQGLLYLFDPLKERNDRNSAEYFTNTIVKLSGLMARRGKLVGQYLPHELSVCITKFDDQVVFPAARRAGLVDLGRDGSPRVPDEHAERYFEKLCDGSFWSDRKYERNPGGAPFIRAEIRRQFHPDRVRYFVTSSVGFRRTGSDGKFDPGSFANVLPRGSEASGDLEYSIIDPVDPINVLEPLISLQRRISAHGNAYV